MTRSEEALRLMEWGNDNTRRETKDMQALAGTEKPAVAYGQVAQWVVAAQHGDLAAFEQLVKRYAKAVSAVAYGIVGDWETAQDIAQDTFLKALRSLGNLQQPGAFAGWLMSVARNQAVSHLRRLELENRTWAQLAQEARKEASDAGESVDAERLERELSKLPPGYREVLLLKYMQQCDVEEIASELGLSAPGVETRLKRARKLLQAAWRSGSGESAVEE